MLYAPCSKPYALCSMLYAPCPLYQLLCFGNVGIFYPVIKTMKPLRGLNLMGDVFNYNNEIPTGFQINVIIPIIFVTKLMILH